MFRLAGGGEPVLFSGVSNKRGKSPKTARFSARNFLKIDGLWLDFVKK